MDLFRVVESNDQDIGIHQHLINKIMEDIHVAMKEQWDAGAVWGLY